MRQICTVILLLTSLTTWGQVGVVGKVYVNERELEVIAHGPPFFEFEEYGSTLTTSAKQYLDNFGELYRGGLFSEQKLLIELTPGLTEKERVKDKNLGIKRLTTIIHYLERNYGVNKSEFQARYLQTITNNGCVGFLAKKMAKREKKEEDNYFKDQ